MHHSSQPDPEISRMHPHGDELGATGEFPEGHLTESDEGEIKFAVGYKDGKVVLDFGGPVAWMGMHPDQAKELASLLLKWANTVTRPTPS